MGLFGNKNKVNTDALFIVDLDSHIVYEVGSKEYKKLINNASDIRTVQKNGKDIILAIDGHVIVECNLMTDALDVRRKSFESVKYYETRHKISFGE